MHVISDDAHIKIHGELSHELLELSFLSVLILEAADIYQGLNRPDRPVRSQLWATENDKRR